MDALDDIQQHIEALVRVHEREAQAALDELVREVQAGGGSHDQDVAEAALAYANWKRGAAGYRALLRSAGPALAVVK